MERNPLWPPQGSILGQILFEIFLNDIFLIVKDVKFASYAHDKTKKFILDLYYLILSYIICIYKFLDKTMYYSANNIKDVINGLQHSLNKLFN